MEYTTLGNNIAIAKFMGFEAVQVGYADTEEETEWQRNHEEWMEKVGLTQVGRYIVNVKENIFYEWSDMKYHSSWDWLMPVVDKLEQVEVKNGIIIRTCADVKILYKACIIEYNADEESGDKNEDVEIHANGETKLEAVYKAIYQFIQWYNNKSNTTNDTTTGNNKTH